MERAKRLKIVVIISVVVIALFGYGARRAKAYDFAGWEQGASGHDYARQQALNQEDPLIIYFSTDWCIWCQKLNKMYLESPDVQAALQPLLKVNINPDKGSSERRLQQNYGIRGFPAFLVTIPAFNERPVKVHPFLSNGVLTTTDFVNAITSTIERQYNNRAVSLSEQQQYDDALRYLNKALEYYQNDSNLHYNFGLTFLAMAQKDHDAGYLAKAEESYQAALEIEPGHERAKSDLVKIEQLKVQWEKDQLASTSHSLGSSKDQTGVAADSAGFSDRVESNRGDGRCQEGDCVDGEGVFVFVDGDRYEGDFKDGRFNGRGKYRTVDGDTYEGEFKDDAFSGFGTYTYVDGRKYTGEFKDDEFNGHGTLSFPNGEKYVGEFEDDRFNGRGTFFSADGKKQEGQFVNGMFIGN